MEDSTKVPFDEYANIYERSLQQGLSLSGESADYFAESRVQWLKFRMDQLGFTVRNVLDFGCGKGLSARYLAALPGSPNVLGLDISPESIRVAKEHHPSSGYRFQLVSDHRASGDMDLVFCNGVFHHIPVKERSSCLSFIYQCLRPGGLFAFWENNPGNFGTRIIMSRVPFDRDAIIIWPRVGKNMMRLSGFEMLRTDYQFIFPRSLRLLRPLEPKLAGYPLGAQYMILSQKPGA